MMMKKSGSLLWLVAVSYARRGDASATNASQIIGNIAGDECPSSFSEEFHSFIFVEECLAGMTSTQAGNFGCPVTVVESVLTAFFKESRVQSSTILPICFSAWGLLFLRSKVPTRKSFLLVWILLQAVTIASYLLSATAFVLALANLCSWFHGCMVRVGSVQAPLIYVTLTPLAPFLPAGASKLVPTAMLLFEHGGYDVDTGRDGEHHPQGDIMAMVMCLGGIMWGLLLLFAALGLLYWMVTLSFLGSIVCIGVSCAPIAISAVLLVLASTQRAERFFVAMGFSKDSAESFVGSGQSRSLFLCNLYLVSAPKIVFGSIVVWAVYSQHFEASGEEAVRAIYSFVFSIKGFELPSFVDFPEFFADPLSLFEHLANLPNFAAVHPGQLLRGSTYFAVLGTVFGLLRTIIITVPILLNWAEGRELELANLDK